MCKRLTLEEVKKIIKDVSGYDLLESEYKNKDTKMTCIDSDGYKYYSSFASLKKCGKARAFHTNNPYTIENIKLWMKLNGKTDTLLSTIYIGNGSKDRKDKLSFICKNGHEFQSTWIDYKDGVGCLICKRESGIRNTVKKSYG